MEEGVLEDGLEGGLESGRGWVSGCIDEAY